MAGSLVRRLLQLVGEVVHHHKMHLKLLMGEITSTVEAAEEVNSMEWLDEEVFEVVVVLVEVGIPTEEEDFKALGKVKMLHLKDGRVKTCNLPDP